MTDPSATVLALLALAGLTAGFVDSVVGGGGLVQLPALLLGLPGASPAQVLATNKLGSVCGTATSSLTYYRRVRPEPRTFVPLMATAFAGSTAGALVASRIPRVAFEPIVLVAILAVGAFVLLRPDLGETTRLRFAGRRHTQVALLGGAAIGFYDGALGPGTGSFLVIGLVGLGYAFVEASAHARLANFATNFAAFAVFVPQGAVLWQVGLVVGVANLCGSYLGARTAVARGSRFVRGLFLAVVGGFVVRLGGSVLGVW
ncbi:TSUP family transporter [Nocardioides sp. TRM66260-LWL]|uniref:TSUP family transporter n=1 Tax=Nocardioides sp. TRM66260-LWL TaxID=2874478 RepID=UPI001CC80C66|nr:TSUP family transporter [Nocardioides sp. TRM66260-LWL]MBZ5736106.1 TSUP family transporter [Nocardioides sp. TRM66260-LWL]